MEPDFSDLGYFLGQVLSKTKLVPPICFAKSRSLPFCRASLKENLRMGTFWKIGKACSVTMTGYWPRSLFEQVYWLNPLTPVPPVTARDEPWPFFHFWRHHLWPNLASSILNFRRRKRSLQWCLVHSDWLIGTSNMPKNAQKVERKTRSQISCHYT